MKRRDFAAALAAIGTGCGALAQPPAYPSLKPIRLLVGFTPGGAADYVARVMSEPLARILGQSIVVENRPGAGASIATDLVAKSAADGYTILLASPGSMVVNPALNPKLAYTLRDFAPITKVTSSPLVIAANPASGINSIQDLIAKAKKNPGSVNCATAGNGSAPHLGAALFSQVTGVQMTLVPFRGGAPAIQSVVAGDTHVTFGTPPSVLPMIQAGRLKGLGITARNSS
ncbi:MAG TPA: tripartite tricarboxylate transporter substrate-binding protein, partial [Ramlibacter sp.]|nr:tripartite tricarboxylate transporter substrate-binding protein [Ramlibacter sp.]